MQYLTRFYFRPKHASDTIWSIRRMFWMFRINFDSTQNYIKMLQVYETLVRGSLLKNDGYETICFVKLIIYNF